MAIFQEIYEKEHKTIIMITHDMDLVAQYAKRVMVLDNGTLVYDGPKERLFEHPRFEEFHLDMPTPLKILKHLEKEIGLPYKPHYDYPSLLQYLKEVHHE